MGREKKGRKGEETKQVFNSLYTHPKRESLCDTPEFRKKTILERETGQGNEAMIASLEAGRKSYRKLQETTGNYRKTTGKLQETTGNYTGKLQGTTGN